MNWIKALNLCDEQQTPCVLASIINTLGSSPRGVDAKMLITLDDHYDTIGGGAFEQYIIEKARTLLSQQNPEKVVIDVPLGPDLEQCCGGYVGVLLEPLFCDRKRVILFGAGTISNEITTIFSALPISLIRYDNRPQFIGKNKYDTVLALGEVEKTCRTLNDSDEIYIMTHDHALDYTIVATLLRQHPRTFIHVIGSETKAARFRHRLEREGFSKEHIRRLRCPIAKEHVNSRKPMAIAVAICHDYLKKHEFAENSQHPIDIKPYLNKSDTRH